MALGEWDFGRKQFLKPAKIRSSNFERKDNQLHCASLCGCKCSHASLGVRTSNISNASLGQHPSNASVQMLFQIRAHLMSKLVRRTRELRCTSGWSNLSKARRVRVRTTEIQNSPEHTVLHTVPLRNSVRELLGRALNLKWLTNRVNY